MASIEVKNIEEREGFWLVNVHVADASDSIDYQVTLEKPYYEKLTGGKSSPVSLVKRSFEYLMSKGTKEEIFRSFKLQQIKDFYPTFETDIKEAL
jgi:hypothetical protein